MRWLSGSSDADGLQAAFAAAAAPLTSRLDGVRPDLVLAFVSSEHRARYAQLPELVAHSFPGALLLGCSAESVIGGGREIEDRPGLSLTAAVLPGVTLRAFHLDPDLPRPLTTPASWARVVGVGPEEAPAFVLLGDPFSVDAEGLVSGLDLAFPQARKVGGLASGGREPGQNALFLGSSLHRTGAIGVALSGDVVLDTIVAQGCRPIGNPMFVTRCRDGVLLEVDGRPPLDVLQHLFDVSGSEERELMRSALFLGIEMKSGQSEYRQGDFLIRNLIGMDDSTGGLAVAAPLQDTQVVQFHVRDAATSAADLEERLTRYRTEAATDARPRGALLFSCLGRGVQLYGEPDHDSDALRRHLGDLAVGGFFCSGEIGPVQGRTFLHGYTSAFGIVRPRT
jgi:small ligand-binding sensory domain FIST